MGWCEEHAAALRHGNTRTHRERRGEQQAGPGREGKGKPVMQSGFHSQASACTVELCDVGSLPHHAM
jgi:hypothetical protein